jgi:hypothetical protein
MQINGWKIEAVTVCAYSLEDVENSTTKRKIVTAEKPKRQSLIHQVKPKNVPTNMKRNHKPQQKRDSAAVLLPS